MSLVVLLYFVQLVDVHVVAVEWHGYLHALALVLVLMLMVASCSSSN